MIRRFNVIKWAVYALCVLLLTVFQMQAAFYPSFMGVTPIFAVPAVISIAMFEGETVGGVYGVFAGIIWDCGTGRAFGFNALFLMCIGIAVGLFVKFLFRNTPVSAFMFTLVFTTFLEFVTWFFFYYMTDNRDIIFALLNIMLPTVILTIIFALPFYFGARRINRKLTVSDNNELQL
jgi:rod shape-determining protein MreD